MLMFGNYGVSKHTPPETNVYAMIIFATDTIIFTGFHVVLVRTRIIFNSPDGSSPMLIIVTKPPKGGGLKK